MGNCLLWQSLRLTGERKAVLGLLCKLAALQAALPSYTSVAQQHLFTSPSSPIIGRHTQLQRLHFLHPLSLFQHNAPTDDDVPVLTSQLGLGKGKREVQRNW